MKKSKEVYVVDDDKIFHFVIKKLFANNKIDINPSFFFNGLEAIEKIRNNISLVLGQPAIILLDLNMPIMDGWQFMDEFRKINFGTDAIPQICIISSSDSISDINKAKEYQDHIKEYIVKPITIEGLNKIF